MQMNDDEHHRYIFEKFWAAVDTETAAFARKQPGLDHDRIRGDLKTILGPYLRSKRNPTNTSEEEYWAGLKSFMGEAYPGNEPRGEYEAVYNQVERVKKRMGWDQIDDTPFEERFEDE